MRQVPKTTIELGCNKLKKVIGTISILALVIASVGPARAAVEPPVEAVVFVSPGGNVEALTGDVLSFEIRIHDGWGLWGYEVSLLFNFGTSPVVEVIGTPQLGDYLETQRPGVPTSRPSPICISDPTAQSPIRGRCTFSNDYGLNNCGEVVNAFSDGALGSVSFQVVGAVDTSTFLLATDATLFTGDPNCQFGRQSLLLSHARVIVVPPTIPVSIDVKPGADPNSVNVKSVGTIPVAILSSPTFDAPSKVDTASLTFGRTGDEPSLAFCSPGPEDVNGDGLPDLVCHFDTQRAGFKAGDTVGILRGHLLDGTEIEGRDTVRAFFPGDVDGNLVVNVADLALTGVAFGSTPGANNWNAYADFDENSAINIEDLSLVGKYFGQHA